MLACGISCVPFFSLQRPQWRGGHVTTDSIARTSSPSSLDFLYLFFCFRSGRMANDFQSVPQSALKVCRTRQRQRDNRFLFPLFFFSLSLLLLLLNCFFRFLFFFLCGKVQRVWQGTLLTSREPYRNKKREEKEKCLCFVSVRTERPMSPRPTCTNTYFFQKTFLFF